MKHLPFLTFIFTVIFTGYSIYFDKLPNAAISFAFGYAIALAALSKNSIPERDQKLSIQEIAPILISLSIGALVGFMDAVLSAEPLFNGVLLILGATLAGVCFQLKIMATRK